MDREQLLQNVQDCAWHTIVENGCVLLREHPCDQLGEAIRFGVNAALFIVENNAEELSAEMVCVVSERLRKA